MANHNSTKKSIRKNEKRTLINKSRVSRIRTFLKKVEKAITSGSIEDAKTTFRDAQSELMKGVSKGVVKLNSASRKVSRLSSKIKKMAS